MSDVWTWGYISLLTQETKKNSVCLSFKLYDAG